VNGRSFDEPTDSSESSPSSAGVEGIESREERRLRINTGVYGLAKSGLRSGRSERGKQEDEVKTKQDNTTTGKRSRSVMVVAGAERGRERVSEGEGGM